MRLLIVEDDARWLNELQPAVLGEYRVVTNLADGIRQITSGEEWDAAIFDMFLMEGDLPFGQGKLGDFSGVILACEFQEKFPGKRMIISTGAPHRLIPPHIKRLLHPELCRYIFKRDSDAIEQVIRFLQGESPSARYNQNFLRAILDSLMLEPNIAGIGINLRVIIDWIVRDFREKRQKETELRQDAQPQQEEAATVKKQDDTAV